MANGRAPGAWSRPAALADTFRGRSLIGSARKPDRRISNQTSHVFSPREAGQTDTALARRSLDRLKRSLDRFQQLSSSRWAWSGGALEIGLRQALHVRE